MTYLFARATISLKHKSQLGNANITDTVKENGTRIQLRIILVSSNSITTTNKLHYSKKFKATHVLFNFKKKGTEKTIIKELQTKITFGVQEAVIYMVIRRSQMKTTRK